jgi:predicted enzyme related to lactoylglutathione lyase
LARLQNITFACQNPIDLAEFWRAALGYEHLEVPPDVMAQVQKAIDASEIDPTAWAMLVPPGGGGPRLLFQRRPKSPNESIPIHLDLNADDVDAEVARLAKLGATVIEEKRSRIGDIEERCIVMRDPEGNGFCVQ